MRPLAIQGTSGSTTCAAPSGTSTIGAAARFLQGKRPQRSQWAHSPDRSLRGAGEAGVELLGALRADEELAAVAQRQAHAPIAADVVGAVRAEAADPPAAVLADRRVAARLVAGDVGERDVVEAAMERREAEAE